MKEWFAFLIAFLKFLFYVFYLKYLKEFNKCIQLFHRWRNYSRWWQPIMVKIHLIRSSIYSVGLLVEILITFAENIWILGNKTAPAVGPKKGIRMCERGPCLLTSSLICGQANKSSGNNCLRLNSLNYFTSFHWNSALPSSRWNIRDIFFLI